MRSPRAALAASIRVSDDVVLARSLGYIQLAAAGMAVVFAMLLPSGGVDSSGMLMTALVGAVFAAVLLRAQPVDRPLWIPLAAALSTALISLYVFLGGESATPFALFFPIAAGAIVWCRSGFETILQVAWMILCYSLAVWATPEPDQAAWPGLGPADIGAMVTLAVTLSALTALVWQFKLRFVEGDRQAATLVEFSRDAIAGIDPYGCITTWNRGAEELYGYSRREMLGRHISILSPPHLRDEQDQALEQMRAGEVLRGRRTERVRRDGSKLIVSLSISPITDAEGKVIGGAVVHHDITEEEAAADRLALQAAMLDEVDGAVIVTEAGGAVTFWSRGAERLLGYTAEAVTGRSL
jgi:PAS domain S-box-containing protein